MGVQYGNVLRRVLLAIKHEKNVSLSLFDALRKLFYPKSLHMCRPVPVA